MQAASGTTELPRPGRLERLGLTPVSATVWGLVLIGYFVVFPELYGDRGYYVSVATNVAILAFISMGVWLTFAIGRINIGQGAFALLGGYVTAILSTRYGVSFWLCLPLAGIVAAAVGWVLGLAILRLKGVYCAMITLTLTKAANLVALNGGDVTQGARGITNIPRPGELALFGVTLIPDFAGGSHLSFYYLAGVMLLLATVALWRIWISRLGWVFRSLQQNEELAQSIGINITHYRTMAYAICCALGGMGGAFFAVFHQNIFPSSYTINDSVYFMLYCFLGGLDYVAGAIVGAFLLVVGFEFLHAVQAYQALIYGVLMIVLMLWLPNGILSLGRRP